MLCFCVVEQFINVLCSLNKLCSWEEAWGQRGPITLPIVCGEVCECDYGRMNPKFPGWPVREGRGCTMPSGSATGLMQPLGRTVAGGF